MRRRQPPRRDSGGSDGPDQTQPESNPPLAGQWWQFCTLALQFPQNQPAVCTSSNYLCFSPESFRKPPVLLQNGTRRPGMILLHVSTYVFIQNYVFSPNFFLFNPFLIFFSHLNPAALFLAYFQCFNSVLSVLITVAIVVMCRTSL